MHFLSRCLFDSSFRWLLVCICSSFIIRMLVQSAFCSSLFCGGLHRKLTSISYTNLLSSIFSDAYYTFIDISSKQGQLATMREIASWDIVGEVAAKSSCSYFANRNFYSSSFAEDVLWRNLADYPHKLWDGLNESYASSLDLVLWSRLA